MVIGRVPLDAQFCVDVDDEQLRTNNNLFDFLPEFRIDIASFQGVVRGDFLGQLIIGCIR